MLKVNEGSIDRIVRTIVGAGLLVAFFMFPDAPWRYWTLIGIVPLVTGLFGICPAYALLGISTCPLNSGQD